MKKQLRSILAALLLCATLIGTLTGCNPSQTEKLNSMEESERAFALLELTDANGEAADSYTVEMDMKLEGVFGGIDMKANAKGEILYTGLKGASPAYHSALTTELDMLDGQIESTVKTQEGYQDGKMYHSYRDQDVKQKFWSSISWADYTEYQEDKSEIDFDVQPDDCSRITCVQEEDGSWTATMAEFTKSGLKSFQDLTEGFEELFGEDYAIKDVSFTFKATEDFFLTSFALDFTFEALDQDNDEELPKYSIEASVEKYGSTEPEEIDFEDYTKIADLRLLNVPEEEIKELLDGEKGEFEMILNQKITVGANTNKVKQESTVSFTNMDDRYTFNIVATQDGYKITTKYADRVQKQRVTQNSKVLANEETKCTDEEAKEYIDTLILQSGFSTNLITDIKRMQGKDNVFVFFMNSKDNTLLQAMAGSNKIDPESTVKYTATIEEGKLLELKLDIDAKIITDNGSAFVTLTITYGFDGKSN